MKCAGKIMSTTSVRLLDDLLVTVSRVGVSSSAVSACSTEESKSKEDLCGVVTSFIGMDDFAKKNFKGNSFSNNKSWIDCDWQDFAKKCNEYWISQKGQIALQNGYAPFCKHLFVPVEHFHGCLRNKDIPDPMLEITDETRSYLRSGYVRRREEELPYLTRWFDRQELIKGGVVFPQATWFDVILYSRTQIIKENLAMGKQDDSVVVPHEWGIVSIKAHQSPEECPMEPITALRNALPLEHGGSGTALSHEDYLKAVEYWDRYAPIQG